MRPLSALSRPLTHAGGRAERKHFLLVGNPCFQSPNRTRVRFASLPNPHARKFPAGRIHFEQDFREVSGARNSVESCEAARLVPA